jgi:hypothetical protein
MIVSKLEYLKSQKLTQENGGIINYVNIDLMIEIEEEIVKIYEKFGETVR